MDFVGTQLSLSQPWKSQDLWTSVSFAFFLLSDVYSGMEEQGKGHSEPMPHGDWLHHSGGHGVMPVVSSSHSELAPTSRGSTSTSVPASRAAAPDSLEQGTVNFLTVTKGERDVALL